MARTATGLSSINFTRGGQADQGAKRAVSAEFPTCEFGRRRIGPCRRHIDTRAHIRKCPRPASLTLEAYLSGQPLQPPGNARRCHSRHKQRDGLLEWMPQADRQRQSSALGILRRKLRLWPRRRLRLSDRCPWANPSTGTSWVEASRGLFSFTGHFPSLNEVRCRPEADLDA